MICENCLLFVFNYSHTIELYRNLNNPETTGASTFTVSESAGDENKSLQKCFDSQFKEVVTHSRASAPVSLGAATGT